MKILVMSLLDIRRDENGVVVSAKEHAALLQKKHWNVILLTPYTYSSTIMTSILVKTSELFRRLNWSWVTLLNLSLKSIILIQFLRKFDLRNRILHAHDVISAGIMLYTTKQPVFLQSHFHSTPWDEFEHAQLLKRNSMSYRFLKMLFLQVLRHPKLRYLPTSIANSQFVSELIGHEPKIAGIMYPGISQLHKSPRSEEPYLINAGTIDSRKNQIVLVDILHELEKIDMGLPLYLVGPVNPSERNRILQRKEELQVKSEVIFTGLLTSEQTREIIAGAKLYIHTSRKESFGRALVEAMASGTPVVAREYPAVHEILSPSAIMPAGWNASEMAQFIATRLASDRTLEMVAQTQANHFLKKFTETQMYNTYLRSIRS